MVRLTLIEQLEPLDFHRESRIAIYGTGEFAELVYLGLKDLGIEEIDIFGMSVDPGKKFLGVSVQNSDELNTDDYDKILISELNYSDSEYQWLYEKESRPGQLISFFSDGTLRGKRH